MCAACLFFVVPLAARASAPDDRVTQEIELSEDLDAAFKRARRDEKPVVAVFGAIWCSACRRFKRRTLTDEGVLAFAPAFEWVYVEIDRNVSLARSYGVSASPQILVLSSEGDLLGEVVGAMDPGPFSRFLARYTARALPNGFDVPDIEDEPDAPVQSPLTWAPDGYRARSICFSHVGFGPLDLPSQAPGQVLRLGLRPRAPSTLVEGQYELSGSMSVANIFAFRENDYLLDYLTVNTVVSLAYGFSDTVLIELDYSTLIRGNSVLDPITDEFHDLFGLGDSGRSRFPRADNVIDLELIDGVEIENDDSGLESSTLGLSLQHNVTCGTESWPAFSYALDLSRHLGGHADLDGRHDWSYGVSTTLARRIGEDYHLYFGAGHVWHGLDEARGLPLATRQWSGLLALEWRYEPDRAWVLQYLVSEGVARDRDPFDKASHELNLGWKLELESSSVLEIGLIENIIEADNSPDFGLHLGIKNRF